MSLVEFKEFGFNEALGKLKELSEKGTDIRPVFNEFLEEFKSYIKENWRSNTGPFGARNKTLKSKYYKDKKLTMGGQGWADLVLTGRLKSAATGGTGWTQKVTNRELKWGIDTNKIKYAMVHQTGGGNNIPQRPYFALKDGSLPGPMYQKFKDITNRKLNEVIDK